LDTTLDQTALRLEFCVQMSQNCSHTRNRPCSSHSTSSCSIINVNNIINSVNSNNLLRPKSCYGWIRTTFFLLICLILILDSCTVTGHPTKSRSTYDFKHSSRSLSRLQRSHPQATENGYSLSIVSSLDVLRQNMVLEMKRQHIRHAKHKQIETNKEILDRIGWYSIILLLNNYWSISNYTICITTAFYQIFSPVTLYIR